MTRFATVEVQRSVMILAAMQGLASQSQVLNALRENAVSVAANSRTTVQHAEVKVGSVTLRNTAVGSLQSVRQMCTSEMEQHATMARPIASLESARLTTNSASTTLEPVSIMQFQPGSVYCNSKSMCSHCKATHTPTVFTLLVSDNLRGTMYNLLL